MVATIKREIITETTEPDPLESGFDPILRRALERKDDAEAALKNAEAGKVKGPDGIGMYCCSYAKKASVNAAKNYLKKINDWLAFRASMSGQQMAMDLDDEDEPDEDEDDWRV